MKLKGTTLPKDEAEKRFSLGLPKPNGFTGRWGDAYFYKGKQWFGPTNLVGVKKVLGRNKMLTNPAYD